MANHLEKLKLSLRSPIGLLLLAALWALLLLSLQSGAGGLKGIIHPSISTAFLHSLRAAFPLTAAIAAVAIILAKRPWQHQQAPFLFGPLGLAAVYGLVGLLAAFRSPDGSIALYWAASYLSVPLVLWAIVWSRDPLGRLRLLINVNWLIIFLAVVAFFAWAWLYRDLGSIVFNPSALLECRNRGLWFGEVLRSTGVGRYAAIAAIISLSMLWQPRWRSLWGLLLLASLILLLTTGARGAIVALAAGFSVVAIAHLGKRAIVAGVAALLVLAPLAWTTGFHHTLMDSCFASGWTVPSPAQNTAPLAALQIPPDSWVLVKLSSEEESDSAVAPQIQIPVGNWVLDQSTSLGADIIQIPPGVWALKRVLPQQLPADAPAEKTVQDQEPAAFEAPEIIQIPPGVTALRRVFPEQVPAKEQDKQDKSEAPGAFTLTGRTVVWAKGWQLFKSSPVLGYGFHADRLLLDGQHMHNAFMHALVQTGLIGTVPFVVVFLWGWILLFKALRNVARLPAVHKQLVIQAAGVLAFFTLRSIPESSGAFFGVDWLLLGPLLLYLQIVNYAHSRGEAPA